MRAGVLIAVIAVSLLASACVSDGNDTTTTAETPSTTVTARPTTATSGEPIDLNAYPIPNDTVCFYLANYVAVPADQVDDAEATLNAGGITATSVNADSVLEASTDPDEGVPDDIEQVSDLLSESLGFLEVVDDPLQVSMALRALDFQASPINVIGFTIHIRFQPGTDPSPVAELELPDVSKVPLDGEFVAVVDSGIAPPENRVSPDPHWFYGGDDFRNLFVLFDPVDEESVGVGNPASHGTFISGLIRQVAPSKRVTFAAARLVSTNAVITQGEALPPGLTPTTEIHVAEAMARLMIRHADDVENIKALNLSLGSYVCDPATDTDLVTLNAVSKQWLGMFPASQIMAAAGNEDYQGPALGIAAGEYVPFYPAALAIPGIRGVAAVDRAGREIVWVDKEPVSVTATRSWVDDGAPGADLVNLSGGATLNADGEPIPELVCWSGSSFATAVASAQYALGTPITKDYNSVQGLTFAEANGSEIVTVGGSAFTPQTGCDHNAED
ncbi:MAG TPA: S8 family serine peptidase [Acidimicrobiia bacterium]|nr:S8 family serine peptidase [Acidimicrobiia bacterium]